MFEENSREWTISRKMTIQKEQEEQEKQQTNKQTKQRRGNSVWESNDNLEIPDKTVTSDIPGLPSK